MPPSRPHSNFVMSFLKRSMYSKIRNYHYASDKSCSDFSLKCTKSVWRPGSGRTRWGSLQRSPDILAGFNSGDRDKGWRKGKNRRVWTTKRGLEDRKERRDGRGGGTKKRGKRRGGEISPPQSFLKVGAYAPGITSDSLPVRHASRDRIDVPHRQTHILETVEFPLYECENECLRQMMGGT